MRALRRIAGESRFSKTNDLSDYQVRVKLNQPSLDCIVARRRLLHFSRIEMSRTLVLHALLSPRGKIKQMPWVTLALCDLAHMYEHPGSFSILKLIHSTIPACARWPLVAPSACACVSVCECASRWRDIVMHPKWPDAVGAFFFLHSVHDRVRPTYAIGVRNAFVCVQCSDAGLGARHVFDSQRALDSHSRTKHGVRSDIRTFIGATTVCPSCSVKFSSRVGLITHLSDKRRPKCPTFVREHYAPIGQELLVHLDALDAALRRNAQRLGYSRPLAHVPARKV